MSRVIIALVLVVVLTIIGVFFYLAFSNFPANPQPVEKVLPDARFPK